LAKKEPELNEAPECIHDDMEAYYSATSLNVDTFAPGLGDLQVPPVDELTPRSRRGGWIAELARQDGVAQPQEELLQTMQQQQEEPEPTLPWKLEDVRMADLRILVVHPNLETRRRVAGALEELGASISTCGQAEQAVLQVLHERPDAVLAEMDLDDFDSTGLCRKLHDRVPEIPVLLVAPGHDDGFKSIAMESGAADFLRRPLSPDFVAERIRTAVAHTRSGTRRHKLSWSPAEGAGSMPHLSRQLRRQELKIQSLFELSKNIVGCVELDELYQGFLLNAMGQMGLASGVLYHLRAMQPGRPLEIIARGIARRDAQQLLDFRTGLGSFLLRAPQPLLLEDGNFPNELAPDLARLRSAGFAVACPMAAKSSSVGLALFGVKVSGAPFTADDLVMLTAICNFAGPALEGARLYSELQRTYLSTVRAFVSSLEAKDAYTRGHSERVADYTRVLGQAMGMSKRDLDMLVFGAVLHDIGKIGVPEGILNKPGPLTPEEWRVVRGHPEMGARIVGNIDYLEPAVGSVLHHHERIDGRGYPHGLVGTDIELGARVVTVADSFDAMTTNRPYRAAMSAERGIELLRANAGRQFDPQIVERFVDLLEDGTIPLD
jgi:response regulator RpfG family c-di-GMP phosphodiesterase